MTHTEKVQAIYAAFGRGDVPAILEHLSEDVDWEYGLAPNPVPWLQRRRGRAEVARFFESLGALEFRRFEPKAILEGPGGVVVTLVDIEATVRATGRTIREEDETHVFRFDAAGRVARFRHGLDSAQHLAAFQG